MSFSLPYFAHWSLQDYVDAANAVREDRGERVSPASRHRVVYVDGVRTWSTDSSVRADSHVLLGDEHGFTTFAVTPA